MTRFWATTVFAGVLVTVALAQNNPTCSPSQKCPSETPCCSAYGQCGVGAYCLGGCDPLSSHSFNSCVPNPVCKSADYQLNSLDDVAKIEDYLGDPSKANWQSQGQPVAYNGNVLLTMAQDTVGTLLASTRYVWYGKISAKLTTSQGAGVVTAFIMMSDVKDEIDFEFIGVDTQTAQSNYYCQGVLDYENAKNLSAANTESTMHEYTIDWQPDQITWSVDGSVMRTVKRSDTWNSTSNRFDYPQTPSRIMLSLWPAGLPSNGKGTIDWAGGLVNWNSPYMQNGYYFAQVQEVSVECYNPPPGAQVNGQNSYVYTNAAATNNTVQEVNQVVILSSLEATGENPSIGAQSASASGTSAPEIPGMSGGGARQENGADGGASGTGAAGAASTGGGAGGFSQGKKNGAVVESPRIGGSIFAVVVAIFGLLAL